MASYSYPVGLQNMSVENVRVGDIVEFDYSGGTHTGKRLVWVNEVNKDNFSGYDLLLISDAKNEYSTEIWRCFSKSLVSNLELFSEKIFKESLYTGQFLTGLCPSLVPDLYFGENMMTVCVTPFVLVVNTDSQTYVLSFVKNNTIVFEKLS